MTAAVNTYYWQDLRRIHRLEYPFPVIYACHALWGACYATTHPRQVLAAPVLLAVIANLIPLIAQNALNGAFDIRADSRTAGKESVAVATRRLGSTVAIRVAAIEFAIAVLLAMIAAIWLNRPIVAIAVGLGVVVELMYNLEPVRLKRRGLANPVFLGLHFSFLPCVATFNAVRPDFPVWMWPFFVGLWVLLIGRTLWWSVPDIVGDEAAGDATLAVRYDAKRAWAGACAATAVGLVLIGWGLWWRHGPGWSLLAVVTSGAFMLDKLHMLRRISNGNIPDESHMRKHSLVIVMIADVALVAIPLVANAQYP